MVGEDVALDLASKDHFGCNEVSNDHRLCKYMEGWVNYASINEATDFTCYRLYFTATVAVARYRLQRLDKDEQHERSRTTTVR